MSIFKYFAKEPKVKIPKFLHSLKLRHFALLYLFSEEVGHNRLSSHKIIIIINNNYKLHSLHPSASCDQYVPFLLDVFIEQVMLWDASYICN